MLKELRSLAHFALVYTQFLLDVGALNIPKAVSLATSAKDSHGVQINVNKTSRSQLIIRSMLSTKHRNDELDTD